MTTFARCRNCGRYVARDQARFSGYCSPDCARRYAQCANCGRYFERPAEGDIRYCSSDCAAVYTVKINAELRDYLREAS